MDIDKRLELLKRIQPVDPPPFLFTRIMARIESPGSRPAPVAWRLTFITALITILSLNFMMFFKASDGSTNQEIESVIYSMELSPSNELYHE